MKQLLLSVSSEGEDIEITVKSNVQYSIVIPSELSSWIKHTGTNAVASKTEFFQI